MSLVVLRSWSDGQPPKIRGIAPPDSDKDEVVVPDHKGQFVTTDASQTKDGGRKTGQRLAPIPHPRSSVPPLVPANSLASPSPSPPVPELRTKSGQQWANSLNRNEKAKTLPPDFQKSEKFQLSRESSVNSGTFDESPPSSPVCGSRYKNLGPELAATIPRRHIIRETWIKESHSNFKKQDMSKSTPALNLSLDPEDSEPQITHPSPPPRSQTTNLQNPRNLTTPRPLSYIDIFYGSDGEPRFGDRPASVVQVFKKDPLNNQERSQSERNLVTLLNNSSEDLKSKGSIIQGPWKDNKGLKPKPMNTFLTKKFKATRSYSSEIRRQSTTPPANGEVAARKDSLPTLPSDASRIYRSEITVPWLTSGTTSLQLPLHKFEHKTAPQQPEVRPETILKKNLEIQQSNFSENPIISSNGSKIKHLQDENEDIELELEALREESSRSTASTAEVETLLGDSPGVPTQSESEMSTTCSSSTASSPQFYFKDNRERAVSHEDSLSSRKSSHESTKTSTVGSAWAQVPVQCVNRHVILPEDPQQIHHRREPQRIHNGPSIQNNYITNQRRKHFCDELLNDVIIHVPQNVQARAPPSSPPPHHPMSHDGILTFDEEEEDELNLIESENESFEQSEREKSVDYISVFHNVQVGSVNESSKVHVKSTTSELVRIVGLDLGNVTTKISTFEPVTGEVRVGPTSRSITTVDGMKHGAEAIPHALATRTKLVYKWKGRQYFPYDLDDDEDCVTTLESFLRHYRDAFPAPTNIKAGRHDKIHWKLSIHSGMDKKLVREAALNTGFLKRSDELRLVSESTAAAVTAFEFLQRLSASHSWGKTFLSVNIGSTFIHTSGYELRGRKLHIIERSDSQHYESPESNFIDLFSRLFGREFILKYESSFQPSWIEILNRFDEMKNLFYKCHGECYLFLPISFYLEYNKFTGMQIPECLEENIEEGVRWDKNGAIRFNKDLMTDWLQPIVNFIKTRLKIKSFDSIVLSGGETNRFIADELKQLLPLVQVYSVPEPENAVVQGLVKIDNANMTLNSPFSIGVGVMTPFDESAHPLEKCVTRQGKKWCSDVWDTLIRKGQPLTIGQPVLKRSYVGAQPGQSVLVLPIFKSDLEDPKLVTSPSVEKCCELRFEINKEKAWREVQLLITCHESELTIHACGNDGEVNTDVIDF